MRKQYHSRPVGPDRHVCDVHRLIRLSHGLSVLSVALDEIAEVDEDWWYDGTEARPTPRSVVGHMALAQKADLSYPIILCADGRLMDGMHRVVRALVEERPSIHAVRFPVTPAPDHINVSLDDLPYPDEEL